MLTRQSVHKVIDEVPFEQLEQILQVAISLKPKKKATITAKKKYLSFAGILSEFSKKDFKEFVGETKKIRKNLFERQVKL
jgi:hypothetical protein